MKGTLSIIFIVLIYTNGFSQSIINTLLHFVENADMNCYYSMIQRNVNTYFAQEHRNFGRDANIPLQNITIINNIRDAVLTANLLDIKQNEPSLHSVSMNIVPLLAIQFVNTDAFNMEDCIYDYISIDSTIVFSLACVDKKKRVKSFVHFFDGYSGYQSIGQFKHCPKSIALNGKKMRLIIKRINKYNPDLLLVTNILCRNMGDVLFVKGSNIFIYDLSCNKSFELDGYIKKKYSLTEIRSLNRKYIPYIYSDKMMVKTTGNTHINQINICK